LPTFNFLKQNTDQRMTIMGSSAMGFGLGFPDNFVDDGRFGYASGRQPEVIVFTQESEQSVQEAHAFLPSASALHTQTAGGRVPACYENVYAPTMSEATR
jgi:hypothetical protein